MSTDRRLLALFFSPRGEKGGLAQHLDDGETTVVGNERYEVKAARNSVLFSRGPGFERGDGFGKWRGSGVQRGGLLQIGKQVRLGICRRQRELLAAVHGEELPPLDQQAGRRAAVECRHADVDEDRPSAETGHDGLGNDCVTHDDPVGAVLVE